ncbi:Phosphoribosyl-dephospho-CoA transferase [Caballeronia novacaledonica]|uniref:Phosphoribosyl-dephospho-CoA transferase n=1 Tax=Caballeronia novacaledonica TaxID=1544861 RepID=A0A2U3I9D3_9BURK|nr:malonate decarboxylase holo-ACP synthase [Caballeronia novacaledonica]SPB16816.1 Phosphoribosyl-dephospho-CoA transferase [Caballeronia novacaledonica]
MNRTPRPHDLLGLAPGARFVDEAPDWAGASLARAPFVVVRRAPCLGDAIAVGVRGATRGERFGTWIEPRWIEAIFTPEDLRMRAPDSARAALPAFALLRALPSIIDRYGLAWGPAGSAGFELASATPTITRDSDLDIVVRAPSPLPRADASSLFDALSHAAQTVGTRIDVQIETPDAAFSLAEFARAGLRVMLRHAHGPRLVDDPWTAA